MLGLVWLYKIFTQKFGTCRIYKRTLTSTAAVTVSFANLEWELGWALLNFITLWIIFINFQDNQQPSWCLIFCTMASKRDLLATVEKQKDQIAKYEAKLKGLSFYAFTYSVTYQLHSMNWVFTFSCKFINTITCII